MDINNINQRLSRMYAALDALWDVDVQDHIEVGRKVKKKEGNKVTITYSLNFAGKGQADAQNVAMMAIAGVIGLKDHLKNQLGSKKQVVENHINQSEALCIALDLWNKDKHGTPLHSPPRSTHDPELRNVKRVLALTEKGQSIILSPITGKVEPTTGRIKVTGDVVDSQGVIIMTLEELIESCVESFEEFMTRSPEINFP